MVMIEFEVTVIPLAGMPPDGLDGRVGRDLRADGSGFMRRHMPGCRSPQGKREAGSKTDVR